jgi:UDP-glucuronate 4-epimerase
LPVTGLRYFTVYGPWGRPDMAPWLFTRAILKGEPIKVFNHGQMTRDFTFVDDIAQGTVRALDCVAQASEAFSKETPLPDTSHAPYRIHNIGHQTPVPLMDFIHTLESALGVKAVLNYLPMQAGDVPNTSADMTSLQQVTGYQATTGIADGLAQWAHWYRETGHRYQAF